MVIVVTGGSGSGKSAYAEERVLGLGDKRRLYLATMQCFDQESRDRVARHRAMRRGKGFETVERPLDLPGLKLEGAGGTVLLECMSNLAANEMFSPEGAGAGALESIRTGIDRLRKQCDNLVVVTNEIFSDGIFYDRETMAYMQLLGRVNAWMAGWADEVVEVVCGIPVVHKRSQSAQPVRHRGKGEEK